MSDFNRDTKQQREMAQKLGEHSKSLEGIVQSLLNLLGNMEKAVEDPTSQNAVGRIKAVVEKIEPNVDEISKLSKKIDAQAAAGEDAQAELANII